MDTTQLQYFKIIAESGSLTKAAKTLHVSQPAMSAMLKKFADKEIRDKICVLIEKAKKADTEALALMEKLAGSF